MPNTINRDMVRLARRALSLSQSELASRTGVPQPVISKFEAGLIEEPPVALADLARALCVTEELLCRWDPIVDPAKATNHYRKKASITTGMLSAAHARINLARIRIARLLDEIAIDSPCRFPNLSATKDEQKPEDIAACARRDWMLPVGPVPNVIEAIERCGGLVVPLDFGTDDIDAVHHNCPGLPPMFFYNTAKSADRMRFSLAHEIGHVIMHDITTDAMEHEANAFAAAFLMPADDIIEDLSAGLSIRNLTILKKKWRVSMQALIYRAKEIGAITERRFENLFIELSKAGWRTKEPYPIEEERPSLLRHICDVYRNEQGHSIDDIASIGCSSTREIERMIYPELLRPEIITFPKRAMRMNHLEDVPVPGASPSPGDRDSQ